MLLVGGGDGKPDKAYGTAKTLLRVMGAKEILPLAGSFRTDDIPAIEDEAAVQAIKAIAAFFSGK